MITAMFAMFTPFHMDVERRGTLGTAFSVKKTVGQWDTSNFEIVNGSKLAKQTGIVSNTCLL
ncbi:MAG: hypothetical protein IPL32_11445 [Chloracidobacterium sp.]|nr:hypothetical protein [Chloracidobacterium sp.]